MQTARYVRLYADADGESHFSDEEMGLRPVTFAPPAPPVNLSAFTPTKQFACLSTLLAGLATGILHRAANFSSGWLGKPRFR
jgi:hypothetical protein